MAYSVLGSSTAPDVRGLHGWNPARTCETPTPSKPPGASQWVGANSARSASAPGKPAGRRSGPRQKQRELALDRGDEHAADRQQILEPRSYQADYDAYREREAVFATTMADRADWERATRQQRHPAVTADAE